MIRLNMCKRRKIDNNLTKADPELLGDEGFKQIRDGLKRAYEKLQKYRKMLNEVIVYWVAVVLYPRKRLRAIRAMDSELARTVEQQVTDYWL